MKINLSAKDIQEITEGELYGSPSLVITGLNRTDQAQEGELSFVSSKAYEHLIPNSQASLLIVGEDVADELIGERAVIKHPDPYAAFIKVIMAIDAKRYNNPKFRKGISEKAIIRPSAIIGEDVYIGDNCFIDYNVEIGDGAKIFSNVSLANGAKIGPRTVVYPGVRVYYGCEIGADCVIQSNAVIGSDGFGFVNHPETGEYVKIPQIGNVVIGDRCEIGACTTIDRAMVGSTIIGDNVIIDNLVQIAHNVEIGDGSAFAAQAGIAGSTKIGKKVRMGGQSGTAGHISIADGVTVLAKGGVAQSIDKKGEYFGAPARPKRDSFRIEAVIPQLPEMYKELKRLRDEIETLKKGE